MKQKVDSLTAQNKKANHGYLIKEALEAGIVLTGTEIKSTRARGINLRDEYVQMTNGPAFSGSIRISEYKEGNRHNHDPSRSRRLLLHKRETARLAGTRV